MIYHDSCYRCVKRKEYIDDEVLSAKKFYDEFGCAYIFSCGASYKKEYMNRFGVEIMPRNECLDYAKPCQLVQFERNKVDEIKKMLGIE